MLRVAIGHGEGISTDRVIAQVLDACAAQLGEVAPAAGVLTVSGVFEHEVVLDAIHERFPGLVLVGSTANGIATSPGGFAEDAIGLLLLASDEIRMSAGLGRACGRDPRAAARQAVAQARQGLGGDEVLCLAFPYVFDADPYAAIRELEAALAPGCPVFGAGAVAPPSADHDPHLATLFFGREAVTDALPILLFSGPLEYTFCVENSWTPVGERARVTRANQRTVERIGERTALEFYKYYLGEHSRPARAFPLAVFEHDDDERYYLRIPVSYDSESGAVRYTGPVPEGARVQITEAVRERMLDQTGRALHRAAADLPDGVRPALALAFSCATRKRILGTQTRLEAEMLGATIGDAPVFAVYGASEVAPLGVDRPSMVHQATLVGLFLGTRDRGEWSRPAHRPSHVARDEVRVRELLERRLIRSEAMRATMEETRELNNQLLRTITREVEESRAMIARQNAELTRLYAELAAAKQKSDELLLQILPHEVAEELKERGQVEPVLHDAVTVLFADFKDFTRLASSLSPRALLYELDFFFSEFDGICERHGLEKLKTIGDAYMCAGGIPAARPNHAQHVVAAAWDMQDVMAQNTDTHRAPGGRPWQLRIGINTGPLVAGVIGQRKFAYDIWGDTVNIAARLEAASEPGRINIARTTSDAVREHFVCEPRGRIPVKNAGEIEMYFVVAPRRARGLV